MEIDRERFSMVMLSSEEQLSFFGKRMCTSTGQRLRGLNLPRKASLGKLTNGDYLHEISDPVF